MDRKLEWNHRDLTQIFQNSFFNLPRISYISQNPENISEDKDNVDTGKLHGKKIQQMFEVIMQSTPENSISDEIVLILGNHRLTDDLKDQSNSTIADYLRHILYINRDTIGWDNASRLMKFLDSLYMPAWELPDNPIDENFNHVLRLIVDWVPSGSVLDLITQVQQQLFRFTRDEFEPADFWNQSPAEISHWNVGMIADLFETLSTLIYQYNAFQKDEMDLLYQKIETTFEKLLDQHQLDLVDKISLELIYCHGLLTQSIEGVMKAKTRITQLWSKLKHEDNIDRERYRWIFGSFFCQIYSNMLEFEIDVVTRRMIISDIINNYLKPRDVDFEKWKDHLLSIEMHPWTFSYRVQGYAEILYSLLEYAQDLPLEPERNTILSYHQRLTSFLYEILINFFNLEELRNNGGVGKLPTIFIKLQLPISLVESSESTLYQVIKNYLLYETEISQIQKTHLINLNAAILSVMQNNQFSEIFELDMLLNYSKEELEDKLLYIMEEMSGYVSIVNSHTFEIEIIKKFSNLFELIIHDSNQLFNRFHKYAMEVLLWYLGYWFWKFQEENTFSRESQLILAPFISIIFRNLAIYYYQHHQNTKAHLTLINGYFFQATAQLLSKERHSVKNQVLNVLDKFGKTYQQIDFKLNDTELKLKEFTTKSMTSPSKTINIDRIEEDYGFDIDQDTIFEYMNLRDKYSDFINETRKLNGNELLDFLNGNDLFTLPQTSSPILMQKIGKNISPEVLLKHPFPLIRNIYQYSTAIQLFPLSIQLPQFKIDMGI